MPVDTNPTGLPDNLRYIFSKDAATGLWAGFNVKQVRNRLTEIQYDIDHIQADLDAIKNGDLVDIRDEITNIYNEINDLRQWAETQINDLKEWTEQEITSLREWINQELTELKAWVQELWDQLNQKLIDLTSRVDEIARTYEHFETGTQLLFYQKAAPAGWSIVQGLDEATVKIVSSGGGTSVNGQTFSTVYRSQTVGNTALTINQIPAHSHNASSYSAGSHTHTGSTASAGSHTHPFDASAIDIYKCSLEGAGTKWPGTAASSYTSTRSYGMKTPNWDAALESAGAHTHNVSVSSAGSHTHSISVASTGGSQAHTHTLDLTVKHINVIVCRKEIVF